MAEPSSPEGNAITLRIKFKSASLDEFVARYGADVSAGGIFIRTKQPLAVGSLLRFDFSLADGSLLLAGLGTVVWVREPDPSRVGSIPGMGLRFDQLAPESQQIHQQILATKSGRVAGTPTASPPPAPAARPVARPATPAPVAPRSAPAAPVVAQPSRRESADKLDDFGPPGKTEIADKPPSFYFDSLDSARGGGADARQEAAPEVPLEDTTTDSQTTTAADSSWSDPIDISEDGSDAGASARATATPAAADSAQAKSAGDKPARETFDLPPLDIAEPAPNADLPPSPAPVPVATTGRSSSGAVKIAAGQSWLDRAMDMPDAASATPVEATAEHTEEMSAPPVAAPDEVKVPVSVEAERPARASEVFVPEIPEEEPAKPTGQGKKLIVVGIVAAALAFAGVYLLQAKPWQSRIAPEPRPTPTASTPAPVPPPVAPKANEPSQPVVQPSPPVPEPAKPVEKVEAPKPTEEAAKTNPRVVEPAKPEAAVEVDKRPASAGAAKKTAGKPSIAPLPSSPALAAGQQEAIYWLKVRSLPPGAQVAIDGEHMGQAPLQRRILDVDKPHTVTIRKLGFESYERVVSPGDQWEKDGNTQILKIVAKLKRSKGQAAVPSAEPEAQPEPVPEKL